MNPGIPASLPGDILGAALAYAADGIYCGPLDMRTKHPGTVLGKKWQEKTSRDPETIVGWFAGTSWGLFLHMGRSGGVAFDVDHPAELTDEMRLAFADLAVPFQSSRDDDPERGHYLFAAPPGRRLGSSTANLPGRSGQAGSWGEVRAGNMVIVVAPTVHSAGGRYQWERTGTLPAMPEFLAARLKDIAAPGAGPGSSGDLPGDAQAFLEALPGGEPCPVVVKALKKAMAPAPGSRYEHTRDRLLDMVRAAERGHAGIVPALAQLRAHYIASVADTRPETKAVREFVGQLTGACTKIAADPTLPPHTLDLCIVMSDPPYDPRTPLANWRPRPSTPRSTDEPGIDHPERANPAPPAPISLADAHAVFLRWLGKDYDLDAISVTIATAAVQQLDGDPLWILLVSGSGNAKTETVQALQGSGALVTSTISSPGALLSATSRREKSKDATGGLLRVLGASGVLVIKDVTSILSMSREVRGEVLAALREVYDGKWSRNVGTDGGRTLEWTGRLAFVGAVTTAWDQAREVVAAMGDRFVLLRMDSGVGRVAAGRKAIGNTGDEIKMRAELSAAVAGVLAGVTSGVGVAMTSEETELLLAAADVVTLARTGVMHDYRGDVIDAHAPEMPTRFAKQLAQIVRGAVAVGMDREQAMRLAIRCARDSMPPLRLAIVDDLAAHPDSATKDVRKRLGKPRATVDRELQALHMLGVLTVSEEDSDRRGHVVTVWRYSLADGIEPSALDSKSVPDLSVHPPNPIEREKEQRADQATVQSPTDKSGTQGRTVARCIECGPGGVAEPGSLFCWKCGA